MSKPETEVLTSRGESLASLRKAARIFGGWEPAEIVESDSEESAGQPPAKGETDGKVQGSF